MNAIAAILAILTDAGFSADVTPNGVKVQIGSVIEWLIRADDEGCTVAWAWERDGSWHASKTIAPVACEAAAYDAACEMIDEFTMSWINEVAWRRKNVA